MLFWDRKLISCFRTGMTSQDFATKFEEMIIGLKNIVLSCGNNSQHIGARLQITVGHWTILSSKIQVLTGKILAWLDTVIGHL